MYRNRALCLAFLYLFTFVRPHPATATYPPISQQQELLRKFAAILLKGDQAAAKPLGVEYLRSADRGEKLKILDCTIDWGFFDLTKEFLDQGPELDGASLDYLFKATQGQYMITPEGRKAFEEHRFNPVIGSSVESPDSPLRLKFITLLLDHGAKPSTESFATAADRGSLEGLKLLSAKADKETLTNPAILIGAVRTHSTKIVRFLLEQGADPNGAEKRGNSNFILVPLCLAAENWDVNIIRHLLAYGGDARTTCEGRSLAGHAFHSLVQHWVHRLIVNNNDDILRESPF